MDKRLAKWWKDRKVTFAYFLNRDPKYCWSDLVRWAMFRRWHEIWTDQGNYLKTDCGYCMKCIYIDQRKDSYKQARVRVKRRGDRRMRCLPNRYTADDVRKLKGEG